MRQCPKCHNWTFDFDDYFRRFRCLDSKCGWMPPSSAEREIRLLRSHRQPTGLDSVEIPELGLKLTPSYDPEDDVFFVDFGLREPTFDLPEPDGRLIWRIGRHSDTVAGFSIVGMREGAVSKITIQFIAKRKHDIEQRLRRIPGVGAKGRATRDLIERVVVTAMSDDRAPPTCNPDTENAWRQVVNRVQELTDVGR